MARPLKLTPVIQDRICAAIATGAVYRLAAAYGGVDYDTFRRWMKRAQAPRAPALFRGFYEAVKNAEATATVGWLAVIERAARDGTWQAAAWKLERRYPQDWGRRILEIEDDEDLIRTRLRREAEEQGDDPDEAIAIYERMLTETNATANGRRPGRGRTPER
jgi:hypothetical protein